MTGTSTSATIAGTARAASSVFTVTRTSSLPAACRARTCAAVAATSAVSVLVIDWTTIGWALPTSTPPTLTGTVGRRRLTARNLALKDLVLENDPHRHRGQPHPARQTGAGILVQPRVHTHPQGVGVEDAVGERHRRRRDQRNGRRLCTRNGPGGRKVGCPGVRARRVFREEDLERDRPRSRRVIRRRRRSDRNAVDARAPQPGGEADFLRGDERVSHDRNG